jgi:hypothetical protein
MSHFILKLTSGESVYGVIDLDKMEKKMVVIKNPLVYEEYESPEGHTGTALVKYMGGTADNAIPIATASITSMAEMSAAFSRYYDAAVAIQEITDQAYQERLGVMTKRMLAMVSDFQEQAIAASLGKDVIVAFPSDTEDTIH